MTIKGYFSIDVYDCEIKIIISDNLLKSINYYLKKDDHGQLEHCPSGYAYCPGNGRIGTYYLFLDNRDLSANIINHEKSHIVEFILEDRGIKAKDEVRSYLDGCISQKLDAWLKKRKIKVKSKR